MKTIENSLAVKTAEMRSKQKKMSKHSRLKETEGRQDNRSNSKQKNMSRHSRLKETSMPLPGKK